MPSGLGFMGRETSGPSVLKPHYLEALSDFVSRVNLGGSNRA